MYKKDSTDRLMSLLEASYSPYHSLRTSIAALEDAGFSEWNLTDERGLEPGKAYYVSIYDRTLAAFRVPTGELKSFHIAAAHIDNPCFIIKPRPERSKSGYITLNVERYGGPILNTWLDRPLTISGKVWTKSEDPSKPQTTLFSSGKPVAIIPNLAIHMNRDVNKGVELKVQNDLEPVISLLDSDEQAQGVLLKYIASCLSVKPEDIIDCELFLYNADKPQRVGIKDDLISSPRLDNLTSCSSCLYGIMNSKPDKDICKLAVLFDNEECGSHSKQGAASMILSVLMEKIYLMRGNSAEAYRLRTGFLNSMLSSMIVSLDVAHATHPNHPEKNDPTNHIALDAGVVIKMNFNQRYATDTAAIAYVESICEANSIPFTKFVNQGDQAGGGTLGSIMSANIPAMTVDIGVPILSMHSSRELMSVASQEAMDHFAAAFFA